MFVRYTGHHRICPLGDALNRAGARFCPPDPPQIIVNVTNSFFSLLNPPSPTLLFFIGL